ncbi:unnamed protein product, partial [Didymodactylos carnosus]
MLFSLYHLKDVHVNSSKKQTKQPSSSSLPPVTSASSINRQTNTKPIIMISYAHDKSFVSQEQLLNQTQIFNVWIDKQNANSVGDVWEQIANGIKQSHLLITILTKKYYESRS